MNSGEIAVVIDTNTDPSKLALPRIRIIGDSQGRFFDNGKETDLSEESTRQPPLKIDHVLRPEDYHINVTHYLFKDALESKRPSSG
jgi:hypothetical protein